MAVALEARRGRRRITIPDAVYDAINAQCNLAESLQITFREIYDQIPYRFDYDRGWINEFATEFAVFEEGLVLADVLRRPEGSEDGVSLHGTYIRDYYARIPYRRQACIVYGPVTRVRCFLFINGQVVPREMPMLNVIERLRGFVDRIRFVRANLQHQVLNGAAAAA